MPYSYSFSEQVKKCFVVAHGHVDFQSSVDAMNSLADDPDYDPSYKTIVDLRQVDYRPSVTELFSMRDTVVNLRDLYKGGLTLVVQESELPAAKMLSLLARVYKFEITATTVMET